MRLQKKTLQVFTLNSVFCFAVWLHQTRIGLSLYDVAGQGYLRESVSTFLVYVTHVIEHQKNVII